MEQENNYQRSARLRVERELAEDPDKYKKLGSKGGQAHVAKGFATLSLDARKEISKRGREARALKEANSHV